MWNRVGPSLRTAAIVGALLFCAQAAAQVYRCEQDGVVRYTDKPCGPKAQPLDLPDPIIVPAGTKADLLGEAERRRKAQRAARDEADAAWVKAHEARKAEEERVRSGRITRTVVEGMSAGDVRRIHGEPAVVSRRESASGTHETWSYALEGGRRLHVTFDDDGRVSSVRTREPKR
ncbi:DUF4124 domain-containing protein [Sinimarinibacterium thermocellulolyticum]|uniref:DUF4124 domain-containing protein n=1 Tax=Sinimarinibacterium thermocellulolyticum TaxID=3170016 RepID=A0ABV2A5F2_9GAMM